MSSFCRSSEDLLDSYARVSAVLSDGIAVVDTDHSCCGFHISDCDTATGTEIGHFVFGLLDEEPTGLLAMVRLSGCNNMWLPVRLS